VSSSVPVTSSPPSSPSSSVGAGHVEFIPLPDRVGDAAAASESATPGLATTGSNATPWLVLIGLGGVIAGGALLVLTRRRSTH
jgi:LPXTG-motif cell wall-anchored protein